MPCASTRPATPPSQRCWPSTCATPVRLPPKGRPSPCVVAVLGLHAGAPVEAVAAALVEELGGHLSTGLLRAPDHGSLERAERDLDRVVLSAASDDPAWSFCVRQADHVVLVADAAIDVSESAHPHLPGADLVLVGRRPAEDDIRLWGATLTPWQVTVVAG